MLLPKFYHDTYDEVKSNSRKIISNLQKGQTWEEATQSPLIDTKNNEGLIVLNGPSPSIGKEINFNVFVLLREVLFNYSKKEPSICPEPLAETIFNECLKTPWGTLSLMANPQWLFKEERQLAFANAVYVFIEIFEGEGARYSSGSSTPRPLGNMAIPIAGYLIRKGVTENEISTATQNGMLLELFKKHKKS